MMLEPGELWRRAEAALGDRLVVAEPGRDMEGLLRELELRRLELELQNEELQKTNAQIRAELNAELASNLDVTARRRAELALRNAKEFAENLIQTANAIIVQLDTAGNIVIFNEAAEKVTGYAKQEVAGRNWFDIFVPKDLYPQVWEWFGRLISGKLPRNTENQILTKSGEERFVAWQNNEVHEHGRIVGCVSFGLDITARKRMEESLRDANAYNRGLIEASLDPLVTIGLDGRITDANAATETITGFSRAQLIGTDFSNYFTDPEKARAGQAQVFRDGKVINYPLDVRHQDGHVTSVLYNASVYRNEAGKIAGIFAAARDITAHRQAEEARRLLEAHIQRTQKMESLGILAGGIAHDFNNLMSGLFGCITMSIKSLEQGRQVDAIPYLKKAFNVFDRAKSLSRQLLAYSKGGLDPDRKTMSLATLLRDAPLFALSGSNVEAAVTIADGLWNCSVDANQIGQVIDNLLINARQAMKAGGVVHVLAENVSEKCGLPPSVAPGRYVRIAIRDEGAGMPEYVLDHVFDPFFTTKKTGSGMGLAVSYSIIARHGGVITAESSVGRGSTFSVYLPASDDGVSDLPQREVVAQVRHGRILFMDDEEYIRVAVGGIIEGMGLAVQFASEGAEAVHFFKEARAAGMPFDIVILDLTVQGGKGGREALVELQAIDPAVRAVVSSGYSDDPILLDPGRYGFVDRLEKPYTGEEFENLLGRILMNPAGGMVKR